MIAIDLGTIEYYDDKNNEFVYDKGGIVRFEYSLKVIYEWEGRWKKPFLKGGLTDEEQMDFYKRMALDPVEERFITTEVGNVLAEYIKEAHTATTFTSFDEGQTGGNKMPSGKIYTAEEFYAMMFSAGVDISFENRNLNRLMTVLRIISSQNEPPKKMNKQDIMRQNAELNRKRREQLKSKG
jgi:hypothetical protein